MPNHRSVLIELTPLARQSRARAHGLKRALASWRATEAQLQELPRAAAFRPIYFLPSFRVMCRLIPSARVPPRHAYRPSVVACVNIRLLFFFSRASVSFFGFVFVIWSCPPSDMGHGGAGAISRGLLGLGILPRGKRGPVGVRRGLRGVVRAGRRGGADVSSPKVKP